MKSNFARVTLAISISPFLLQVLAPASVYGQTVHPSQFQPSERLWRSPSQSMPPQRAQSQRMPVTASPDIIWVTCPAEAQALGAMCGTLPVPLDRKNPQGATIQIYFELYLHTNSGPAESAVLFNPGGPGESTTANRAKALALFAANLDVHDFLLIDDRGRGFSTVIDCKELQHGTAPFPKAQADCAAQLGEAASRYGTGDIAMDTDAVRAALGYDQVDYWGASYGGEDVTAYATRFGQHLRSIILDAGDGAPGLAAFWIEGISAHSTKREVRLDCQRSPTCQIDHPDPDGDFVRLIESIRSNPIQGYSYDASGNSVRVNLDESLLMGVAGNPSGKFVNTGELLAAGGALSHGDPAPLLRLGAESSPFVTDQGDPHIYSAGAGSATGCVDPQQPWDWSAPLKRRLQQLDAAVADLSDDYFAPFSKAAGTALPASGERQCLWWQKPTPSSPVVPPGATYPNVPTLAMTGDLDTLVPTEEVRKAAALFPDSTVVEVAEAGHITVLWSLCAAAIESQFLENLQAGDTSCAKTPETVWPALGRFPLVAANARPGEIDPAGGNQISEEERKVVTVAVATAIDALKRSTIGSGSGVGLRAGTFQSSVDQNGNQTTTLTDCAFATDLTVSGTVVWGADLSFVADLSVSGTGTAGGTLHVEGTWEAPGPVGNFKISGSLGGKNVAVLVPEA